MVSNSLLLGTRSVCLCLSWRDAHQGGSGSLWFKLAIREPSERVSWASRCRDCSRTFIWSLVKVAMAEGSVGGGQRKLKGEGAVNWSGLERVGVGWSGCGRRCGDRSFRGRQD